MNAVTKLSARRRRNEIWVGVFVIVGLLAALVVLFTLTSPSLLRGNYGITAIVDSASGVRRGDPVQMKGVNIGRVRRFDIRQDGVAIELEINGTYKIPSDSRIALRSSSLLGEMFVDVQPGTAPTVLANGDSLHGASTGGGALSKVTDVAKEASGALGQIQLLLSGDTVGNVKQSTAELAELLAQLSGLAQELRGVTGNVGRAAAGVRRATAGPELADTVENMAVLTRRLNEVADSLGASADEAASVLGRINRGEGSLGRLSRDETLYANANRAMVGLAQASSALAALAEDVRKQPGRYINLSLF